MGKTLKIFLSETTRPKGFHILCVAMYSGPNYKSCQRCPWGPYGPRPSGGGGGGHGYNIKKSSPKSQGLELSYFMCSII